MNVLVSNDDGIHADGLWALVRELAKIARVTVVAPDREQSAAGTAVTLWQPLRIRKVRRVIPDVETYAVEGTPSDSVILALGNLVKDRADLVVSGINWGMNLGEDVYISGTVSAALQGYLHGYPALAISAAREDPQTLEVAARLGALLAQRMVSGLPASNVFLNVNVPAVPLEELKGVQVTRLANQSHINTVTEGRDAKRAYYWLVRERISNSGEKDTDMWAVDHGYVSITPVFTNRAGEELHPMLDMLCAGLSGELKKGIDNPV